MIAVALTFLVAFCVLAAVHIWQSRQWQGERAELLQRIQAPERAVTNHDRKERPKRPKPRSLVSDDKAQLEAIKRREGDADGDGD